MSASELDNQPDQVLSAEDTVPEAAPEEKSGIRINPNAPDASRKFGKRDTVGLSIRENGVREKGTYTIYDVRAHHSGAYWEYQLRDPLTLKLYRNGTWVREKDLKLEQRWSG